MKHCVTTSFCKLTWNQFVVFMLLSFFIQVFSPTTTFATAWVTTGVGAANSLSNWTNGSSSPTSFTTPGDTWTIDDSVYIPSGATWIIGPASGAPASLTVTATGKLVDAYGSPTKLIVYGDFSLNGGSFIHSTNSTNDTVYIHGSLFINSGAFDFSATSAAQAIYIDSNFVINGGRFKQSGNTTTRRLTVGGYFSMTSGSLLCSGTIPTLKMDVQGSFTASGSSFQCTGTSATLNLIVQGAFTATNSSFLVSGTPNIDIYGVTSITHSAITAGTLNMKMYASGTSDFSSDTIRFSGGNTSLYFYNSLAYFSNDSIGIFNNTHLYCSNGYTLTNSKQSFNGTAPTLHVDVTGPCRITRDTLLCYGTGPNAYYTIYGNCDIDTNYLATYGTAPTLNFTVNGDCNLNYVEGIAGGNSPTLNFNVQGNFGMISSHLNYSGTYARILAKIYGNCSITGSSAMTNSGTAGYNAIHLALPASAGTMQIENTSTGTWARSFVYVDTGCYAQLSNDFSTSTGASPSYGFIVDGKLICPAAYAANGTGLFKLNGLGTLVVANTAGINGNITTSGTKSFHTGANYIFDGSAAQVTGSYLPTSLTSPGVITINNASGVTLSQTTATTGTLTFASGILHTGTYTMKTPGSPAAVTGAGTTSFVDGTLIKTISGYSSVDYEVGDVTYAPMHLTLSSAGTGGSFGVWCRNGLHPSIGTSGVLTSNIVNHYWTLTNYAASGPSTVVPKASYEYADIIGGSNSSFATQAYAAGSWLGTAITSTNTTSPYTTEVTTGISLGGIAGDYIFGNSCGSPITGSLLLCVAGDTATLSTITAGGTWSSSDASVATISSTGLVTGVATGTAVIYYTTSSCAISALLSVGVSPITGVTTICPSSYTVLSDATPGGTWSSASTAVASVSATGVVTATGTGTTTIYYTVGSCSPVATTVSVASPPAITGPSTILLSDSTTYSCATAGGTWTSSNTSVASVSASGMVYGVSLGSATITYALGACFVTKNVTVQFRYIIIADSVMGVDTTCNRPSFYIKANGYSPLLALKTYYGDGTSDSIAFTSFGSYAVAFPAHTYSTPGYYTIKQELYYNNVFADSLSFSYFQGYCGTFCLRFYHDFDGNCAKDTTEPFNAIPLTVIVDSSGIALDTLSATGGIYYHAHGGPGSVYGFRILPDGLNTACFGSGTWYDTVSTTTTLYPANFIGLYCTDTSHFNLGVYPASRFGTHVFQFSAMVNNTYCSYKAANLVLNLSPQLSFSSSTPSPASVSGNTITWHFSGLSSATGSVNISGSFHSSHVFHIGDTVHNKYTISPMTGDTDTGNNVVVKVDTIRGGFDPNFIEVTPEGCFTTDTVFQYTIHFENTGNDTARNIYVLDTLPNYIDIHSLRVLAASADMNIYTSTDGGYKLVKFDFPNINLLDSSHHDLCDGAVVFKVKRFAGMPDGASINNRAGIYFDDNPCVLTNTVSNIKGCSFVNVPVSQLEEGVSLYPNPTTGELTIRSNTPTTSVVITDLLGKTLSSIEYGDREAKLNIADLVPGVYIVRINGSIVRKVVKE